jgi:hypothetical protein
MFNTIAEKEAARGAVEREFSTNRDTLEKQYVQDKKDLEDAYHEDIRANEQARRVALVAAGFGPDGSVPPVAPVG